MRRTIKRKTLAWLLAAVLALPLLTGLTPKAFAADHTYYIDYGNITVAKNAGDASMLDVTFYATSGASSTTTDTVASSDEIVITQTNGSTNSVITVSSGDVHMTLDKVYIYNLHSQPFTVYSGAAVHLTLSGPNKLDTGGASANIAGLNVPSGASVTIDKKSSDAGDSLVAIGGSLCAGIGGGNNQSCGTVVINGGTITAGTVSGGAGIGGGFYGNGGTVTINGGVVTANGSSGAGIGGGGAGGGGMVTINDGIVTANGDYGGAGIGGGGGTGGTPGGGGGTVTIHGGIVTANGDVQDEQSAGAGIGGGGGTTYFTGGRGADVTITGGTVVATGGIIMGEICAANIGGGSNSLNPGTLKIDIAEPDAVIDYGYGGNISGSGPYTITANSGYVIDSLKVDGITISDATGQDSYEIISVSKSLIVTFAYTANFTKPANGSLTVSSAGETITSGQIVRGGKQLSIIVKPDTGYILESLTVNGEDVTDDYDDGYLYTVGTKGYYRTLTAQKDTGTQGAQIAASFVLESSLDDILVSVTTPDAITGILNGTAKTASALGLPSTVTLVTDHESAQASVLWNVAASAYDPSNAAAQTFMVNGTVTLPAGVQNPNSVSLNVSVSVSVDAAAPVPVAWQTAMADGAADTITSTKIGFTFDTAITGLTAENITMTDGTGSAVKGALLGSGTSWSIALDSINVQGTVSVAIASPAGYTLSGSPKVVAVYRAAAGTPPVIVTGVLENGTAGIPYIQALAAAGSAPFTWTVEVGSLPDGLILSGGAITGTPIAAGTFHFTLKAQNSSGSDTKALNITILPVMYTITATASTGGSINPTGPVSVAAGSSQTYTIIPDAGFTIDFVTVDGERQIPVSTYTFTGINAEHTIQAAFALANANEFTFGIRETEVSSTTIHAEGLFKPSAVLKAVSLADGDSDREALASLLSGKEIIAAFECSVSPEDAYKPPLTLRIQVGEQYNGRTVYILHRLHNGNVEQFTPTVAGGEAVISLQELSPFLIAADPWITITAQPQSMTAAKGHTATFSVTAEGETPLSYQWQKKTGKSTAWADILGAVDTEYTTSATTLANSGYQYRVVITDHMNNSVVSDAAALTVVKAPDTGDHSRPVLYAALMILFIALAIMLLRRRKTV
jgi:hypothetical protein